MKRFIDLNLNMDNIDPKRYYKGVKGTYLNVRLVLNDTVDQYGNIGFMVQATSAQERMAGIKLPICGNAKESIAKPVQEPVTTSQVYNAPEPKVAPPATVNYIDPNDLPF